MFNVHLYEKKLKIKNDVEKQKDDFIKGLQKRKEKQNELAANYKKRVENFVINMLENPIVTQEYKGPTAYKIRDEFPEKFLKDPQVYIKGFKHEKDRIRESYERNQDLDYMPNQTVAHYQFRDRNMDKEIQPEMRFTAKTSLERIEQFLKDHMQTQVENIDFRDKKKQKKFMDNFPEYQSPWERRRLLAKEIAKNLLPSLHNKTHFNAATSLYNSCPVSLCDKQTRSQPNLMPKLDQQAEAQDQDDKDANQKAKGQVKSKSKDPKLTKMTLNKEKRKLQEDLLKIRNLKQKTKKLIKWKLLILQKRQKKYYNCVMLQRKKIKKQSMQEKVRVIQFLLQIDQYQKCIKIFIIKIFLFHKYTNEVNKQIKYKIINQQINKQSLLVFLYINKYIQIQTTQLYQIIRNQLSF
ncbi:hypothetical protein TTHERM_00143720 (macronuclear) [Tetrahymena thermophila SB210]|uniref:Uncharacterized protein n=1 Tax=Tetrahymena thermophila (strain SB210) TaxID=312017 RepID=I7LU96_TETTS|nr:hypothetical protein TTHERM_00143720 [Tetrahymena thermophila SB210]EAR90866.3 hypothetical protein TTHERM_00143720 [Tetrahymena thermophila SB210]|eukprot:XP_001011111.3 hypothetical protein TTHERM_00143720 [Tetrahymena thermophila SB210]